MSNYTATPSDLLQEERSLVPFDHENFERYENVEKWNCERCVINTGLNLLSLVTVSLDTPPSVHFIFLELPQNKF